VPRQQGASRKGCREHDITTACPRERRPRFIVCRLRIIKHVCVRGRLFIMLIAHTPTRRRSHHTLQACRTNTCCGAAHAGRRVARCLPRWSRHRAHACLYRSRSVARLPRRRDLDAIYVPKSSLETELIYNHESILFQARALTPPVSPRECPAAKIRGCDRTQEGCQT
jgi:hypothetical protein